MTNSVRPSVSKFISELVTELSSPLTVDGERILNQIKF